MIVILAVTLLKADVFLCDIFEDRSDLPQIIKFINVIMLPILMNLSDNRREIFED